jgi:CheY-like chemotaxis protein
LIQGRTVLIVDQLNDSREVLRTVLQSVGLRTMEAEQPAQGLELARRHRPDLVVLDAEEAGNAPAAVTSLGDDECWGPVPMVVLGRARVNGRHERTPRSKTGRCYLPKPFHFVDLVRTIEELLVHGGVTAETQ